MTKSGLFSILILKFRVHYVLIDIFILCIIWY